MAATMKSSGSGGGGRYQSRGTGNTEMPYMDATIRGKFPSANMGAGRSQGETSGAGSIYAAVLNERPNVSNMRNQGPSRRPSRSASGAMPIVSVQNRKTGRLG